MTTDPRTEAARAYAEQACYQDENRPVAEAGFIAGWTAARTHLAAQEPNTVEVQAFQDCLYGRTGTWVPGVEVRAALSAARAARRDEEKRYD